MTSDLVERAENQAPTIVRTSTGRIEVAPHNCFACGSLNASGLQLELHTADGVCWTETVLDRRFEGWSGIAHGGVVSTLLDEVMAWALIEHDLWGLTARLTVDFRKPAPVGRRIRAEGTVVEVRRRVVQTAGTLTDDHGTVLATAEGTYVGASGERKAELKGRYSFRVVPEGDEELSA